MVDLDEKYPEIGQTLYLLILNSIERDGISEEKRKEILKMAKRCDISKERAEQAMADFIQNSIEEQHESQRRDFDEMVATLPENVKDDLWQAFESWTTVLENGISLFPVMDKKTKYTTQKRKDTLLTLLLCIETTESHEVLYKDVDHNAVAKYIEEYPLFSLDSFKFYALVYEYLNDKENEMYKREVYDELGLTSITPEYDAYKHKREECKELLIKKWGSNPLARQPLLRVLESEDAKDLPPVDDMGNKDFIEKIEKITRKSYDEIEERLLEMKGFLDSIDAYAMKNAIDAALHMQALGDILKKGDNPEIYNMLVDKYLDLKDDFLELYGDDADLKEVMREAEQDGLGYLPVPKTNLSEVTVASLQARKKLDEVGPDILCAVKRIGPAPKVVVPEMPYDESKDLVKQMTSGLETIDKTVEDIVNAINAAEKKELAKHKYKKNNEVGRKARTLAGSKFYDNKQEVYAAKARLQKKHIEDCPVPANRERLMELLTFLLTTVKTFSSDAMNKLYQEKLYAVRTKIETEFADDTEFCSMLSHYDENVQKQKKRAMITTCVVVAVIAIGILLACIL